jgi:HEAT repeat protein
MDSTELIAPHIEGDIAPFLDNEDLAVKRNAIMILGSTQPRPLPRALELLSAHLTDKDNTEMEAGMIAATLIHGRPTDAKTIHQVVDFASGHPEMKLRVSTIQLLGLNNVTVDEAIKYMRGGLADQDPEVRRASVEAVGHMPPESRAKFREDLLRLLANPNELPEARAAAQRALQQ